MKCRNVFNWSGAFWAFPFLCMQNLLFNRNYYQLLRMENFEAIVVNNGGFVFGLGQILLG
ncbi:hypothetical protein DEAC_c18120 [Desulfosporosinus acididurans]|uniref:Uncharacterized protein n=1 Tax=Desulfosporosinus acididurans TaxID=476652 RepID=A0A0J1FTV2_9FIRM|nr:hypothetical protein DEAC_c18120 [Desulfosporosinus acididurans]